nr:hypothetical protein [uncultured Flavobacterium sp.]
MSLSRLTKKINSSLSLKSRRLEEKRDIAQVIKPSKLPKISDMFLPYQKSWMSDPDKLIWCAKGRRTGYTFATSSKAVAVVMRNSQNVYYSTYNIDACSEFIQYCAKWLRVYNHISKKLYSIEIIKESNIKKQSIVLNNGRYIRAIPGTPVVYRGKENALMILDELAFRISDVEDIMSAVLGAVIRGQSTIMALSTHNGIDHPFNKYTERIEKGELKGSYHRTTFRDAITQGYYKNLCAFTGKEWTKENEEKYVEEVYAYYGDGAEEELDAIPKKYSQGHVFKFEQFKFVQIDDFQLHRYYQVRYFDLASTVKKTSFYSATVKLAVVDNIIVLVDAQAEKIEALEGDEWIREIIRSDSHYPITHLIEHEGGASGDKYVLGMIASMPSYQVEGYKPQKDKVRRALPAAHAAKRSKLVIADKMYFIDGEYLTAQELAQIFCKFNEKPEPLITDLTDCLSGAYDYIVNISGMYYDSVGDMDEAFLNMDDSNLIQMMM